MRCLFLLVLVQHSGFISGASFNDLDANEFESMQGKIVGGHEAIPHSHPYIVSLQLRILWARVHFCGGTIVNKNWILTAAHCVRESWLIRWLPMDAVAGTHDVNRISPQAQVSSINERIVHPDYTGGIGPNDIALLKTKESFKFTDRIKPINLPINANPNYNSLKLAGWGVLRTTMFFPDVPDKLQEVTVTYVPYEECNKAVDDLKEENEENPLDKNHHVCTGPLSGGIAACNGDSGGPLVLYTSYKLLETPNDPVEEITEENYEASGDYNEYLESEDETAESKDTIVLTKELATKKDEENELIPVIVGVVSWGISPCGEKGAPTVYTKVAPFLSFINKHIEL